MPDLAAAYAEARTAMTKLVEGLSPEETTTTVPACPDWSVRDLIAHVASIASSVATGSFPADLNPSLYWDEPTAVLREEFVDAGLTARDGLEIPELLQEWERSAETLESMMRGERPWPEGTPPVPEWIVTTDLGVHHHDLRGALDAPGDRDSLATGLGLRSYVEGMRFRAAIFKTPALRIVAGSRSWTIGEGEPAATVTADPFELARAASGRRSHDQIRAFAWEGDPEPFLGFFYPYSLRTEPLVE